MLAKYDLTGNKYKKLTVLHYSGEKSTNRSLIWVCECECGNITKVSAELLRKGQVGTCGHCPVNTYEISESGYIIGKTSNGGEFYFDSVHLDAIKQYNWCFNDQGYLITTTKVEGKNLRQHILIAKHIYGDYGKKDVDHINHIKCDNRSCNLRVITHSQNMRNQKVRNNETSKYKGVSFFKDCNKWRACIKYNYQQIHLGLFDDEVEAAKRYNAKARELFGEYALLNEI